MKTEYISLLLSIFAFLGSIYTYFAHNKKLNSQQKQLNNYQLKKNKEEEEEKKKAHIVANIYGKGKNAGLNICNDGNTKAMNIHFISQDLENDKYVEIPALSNLIPYESLQPGDSFKVPIQLGGLFKPKHKITLIWDDEFEKNRSEEQIISFQN